MAEVVLDAGEGLAHPIFVGEVGRRTGAPTRCSRWSTPTTVAPVSSRSGARAPLTRRTCMPSHAAAAGEREQMPCNRWRDGPGLFAVKPLLARFGGARECASAGGQTLTLESGVLRFGPLDQLVESG